MELLYLITLIVLAVGFMMYKKSDNKINFVKWLAICIVSVYGYNITLGVVLGFIKIPANLWLLSIINLVIAGMLLYRVIKFKAIQKYEVRKLDIVGLLVVLAIFAIMFVKDLYITDGNIAHMAVDSAVHYRAAKHYSENLDLFVNVEDKTFFNFNVMQPGAYINDGIFMRVINKLFGTSHEFIYQMFESMSLFFCGLAFYAVIADKINTKKGLIASLVLFALYMYGYPYNAWFYGFSYLAVSIVVATTLLAVVEELYSDNNMRRRFILPLVGILSFGLIFSYCLFVPAIFAAICIYCFLKDLGRKDEKAYLKIFKKTTLIVLGMLVVITILGIVYLFIPTFFIQGQTNLVSALKIDGANYSELINDFIAYIPFGIIYAFDLIKRIKERKINFLDVFAVVVTGYLGVLYIGWQLEFVSKYYMFKVYSLMWLVIFSITAEMINKYINERNFRMDIIALIGLFFLMVFSRKVSIEEICKIYLGILLVFYMVLPQLIKGLNLKDSKNKFVVKVREMFKDFKPYVSGAIYIILWGSFVFMWVWLKSGHLIGEVEKHSLPNYVGIYYDENCNLRKQVDLTSSINKNEIELIKFAKEEFKDLSADNLGLITAVVQESYFERIWACALLEITSDTMTYGDYIQRSHVLTLDEILNDPNIKYIVKLNSNEQDKVDGNQRLLNEARQEEQIEVLKDNKNGFVARINR